jgi:predicted AAA+ superfamily ATPase
MKPFSSVAIPHRDILEGKLTMDVFAAKIWEVYKKRAHEDYHDSDVFFRKTYLTEGLKNLIKIADKRLKGKGGDPVIQLQTPFGGGKTHSLIAIYHKAKEWKANVIVIDGEVLGPKETTIWEEIEKQLTGKVDRFKGRVSPGGEELRKLFEKYQPLVILLDEVIEHAIPASGVKVGDSTLASQILTFMRCITDTVRTLDKTFLVLTYPARTHYNDYGQRLLKQLQERSGRVEKVYTPIQDEEIYPVIRRRLFTSVNEKEEKEIVEKLLDYFEKEKILPEGISKSDYRKKFMECFPFQPEVIDVLYKKWGTFPDFERTRGVLRLLSLVIHSLKDKNVPYIRIADFDLSNDEIKSELIKYIGPEYSGIIAQDITSKNSGAKKTDRSLGDAYAPFSFGTKVATSIFMCSFSGVSERGASVNEIKLSSVDPSAPGSIVVEAISKLKENLFFLSDKGLYFTTQPNLNRILLTKMDSISDEKLEAEERGILANNLKKEIFDIFLWPEEPKDIPDTKRMKLAILDEQDEQKCKKILTNYGTRPRVYRNTLMFFTPIDSERSGFEDYLKRKLGWKLIDEDRTLSLTAEQKKEVKDKIKKAESEEKDHLRSLYRMLYLPVKDGIKDLDLGIPTYGTNVSIDREIYERLRSEGEILEKFSPLTLKEKYLKVKDFVNTVDILESFFKTPGEMRIFVDNVLKDCIREGIRQGLFGLGDLENEKPLCRHFYEEFSPELVEGEILIKAEICKPKKEITEEQVKSYLEKIRKCNSIEEIKEVKEGVPWDYVSGEKKDELKVAIEKKTKELKGEIPPHEKNVYRNISLKLNVPTGKLADIVRIVNYIKSKFEDVKIKVEIVSKKGEMTTTEYEDKIREAVNMANVEVEEEELE